MSVKKAVDISYHNGVIDFERLKNAVDYVIIRCGYGQDITSQDDKQWYRNVGECERLGIPYGVYFYSYAKTTAKLRVKSITALDYYRDTLLIYLYFSTARKKEHSL